MAAARGLVFGRDLIFTFGPYGVAYTGQYYPATDTMMLASTALLGTAFASGLSCIAQGAAARAGALVLVALMATMSRDALFVALPFTLVLLTGRASMPVNQAARIELTRIALAVAALLVAALGLLSLVKGTFAIASGAALAICLALLVLRRRFVLAVAGSALFAVSLPVFWVLAGQPLAALPGYFASQAPIIAGYTEAMSIDGGIRGPAAYLGCCALLLALHARRADLATIGIGLGTAAVLFLAFKGGFVRADEHQAIAAGMLAIVAWMLALGHAGARGWLGLAAGLTSWALIERGVGYDVLAVPSRIEAPFEAAARMLVTRISEPEALARRYSDSLAMIRSWNDLPPLHGTTDVYSFGQSIVLARGLDWAPRPVLQSYSAYTPGLARQDAAFLAGPRAPENILFTVQPIDSRLGALDDGPSWPILLSRYAFTDLRGEVAILRRREQAGAPSLPETRLGGEGFEMGEMMPLPASPTMLWTRLDVLPTFLGRLMIAVFRPSPLAVVFRFADGREQAFRYIPGMGKAGFLAAPVVTDTKDFVALSLPDADRHFAAKRPVAMTISGGRWASLFWQKTVAAEIFSVPVPIQPTSAALVDRAETAAERLANLLRTPECSIDQIDTHRPENFPVKLGPVVRVAGRATISARRHLAPETIAVTLAAPGGEVTAIRAEKTARDDNATSFRAAGRSEVGFTASADLAGLSGDYVMGLEMTRGNSAWTCLWQVPVRISGAAPE